MDPAAVPGRVSKPRVEPLAVQVKGKFAIVLVALQS